MVRLPLFHLCFPEVALCEGQCATLCFSKCHFGEMLVLSLFYRIINPRTPFHQRAVCDVSIDAGYSKTPVTIPRT